MYRKKRQPKETDTFLTAFFEGDKNDRERTVDYMDAQNDYSIRNIATNPCMLFLRNNLNKKLPKRIEESNEKFWITFEDDGSFVLDMPIPTTHPGRNGLGKFSIEKTAVTITGHKKKNPVMTMHFVDAIHKVRLDISTQDELAMNMSIVKFATSDTAFDNPVYQYLAKHIEYEAQDFAFMNILTERFLFHGITIMKETNEKDLRSINLRQA